MSKKMTPQEAYAKIEDYVKQAEAAIRLAESIAEEYGLEFSFSVAYGMGGTYAPEWESSDWDESDEEAVESSITKAPYIWHASSQSC